MTEAGTHEAQASDPTASEILTRLSAELQIVSEHCIDLQNTLSEVLSASKVEKMSQDIAKLQDLDWIQQTLADVAAISLRLAENDLGRVSNLDAVIASARLHQLRDCIVDKAQDVRHGGEITWF